jgi:type IV pilus assembly protein PilB
VRTQPGVNPAVNPAAKEKASVPASQRVEDIVAAGLASPAMVAQALARALGLPLLDLDAVDAARLPSHWLEPRLALQSRLLPLARRGPRLIVATSDPTDAAAAQRVKFATQLLPDWVVVEHDKLMRLLEARAASAATVLEVLAGDDFDFEIDDDPGRPDDGQDSSSEVEDAPVVRFLHKMLVDAINQRASDLHFEPYEQHYRVRFRVDGEMREIAAPPLSIREKLASRVKVLCRLDIAEKRVPQDGRMKLRFGQRAIDFRVSTLPTLFGEKIVIRILDSSSARLGIEALGYEPEEKARLMAAIQRPYGMILVTGPTGSGKTVSLYTCLNLLNQPGVNICTVEDPAEINLPGINQVNVNDKAGLTFAAALKSFLRQDPDIIMVGEIRDLETADIAIKAAQTGHLVMSTLHTNDAPTTLTRLLNMGVAPFNIAASVLLITAQRLARRLCEACKEPATYPRSALLDAGFTEAELDGHGGQDGAGGAGGAGAAWQPYRPVGCPACHHGFKGRVGLYQAMPITEAIQRIILAGGSAMDIAAQARRDGVRDLRQSGLVKVRSGLTSLEEVITVTNS